MGSYLQVTTAMFALTRPETAPVQVLGRGAPKRLDRVANPCYGCWKNVDSVPVASRWVGSIGR